MKTQLFIIFVLCSGTHSFVPIGVGRSSSNGRRIVTTTTTRLPMTTRRDEIAHEIQEMSEDEEESVAHMTTHDDNPWREVLSAEHESRQHLLKQRLGAMKRENKELDKHVHELEENLTSLFAVAEVLYVQEAELRQEIDDLNDERNSLVKCTGRTVVLLGKRLLWPVNKLLQVVGIKKKQ